MIYLKTKAMIYKTQQSSNHIGDHYIESPIVYPEAKPQEQKYLNTIHIEFSLDVDTDELIIRNATRNVCTRTKIEVDGKLMTPADESGQKDTVTYDDQSVHIWTDLSAGVHTLDLTDDDWNTAMIYNSAYDYHSSIFNITNDTENNGFHVISADLPVNLKFIPRTAFPSAGFNDAKITIHGDIERIEESALANINLQNIFPNISKWSQLQYIGGNALYGTHIDEFSVINWPNLTFIGGSCIGGAYIDKMVIDDDHATNTDALPSIGSPQACFELVYLGPGSKSVGFLSSASTTINKVTIKKEVSELKGGFVAYARPSVLIFEGYDVPTIQGGVFGNLIGNPPSDLVVTVPKGSYQAYAEALPALAQYMVEAED